MDRIVVRWRDLKRPPNADDAFLRSALVALLML